MAAKKNSGVVWAVVAIVVVAGGYALWNNPQWREFDWGSFAASFKQVRIGWLLAATGCVLSTYAIRTLRWTRLMRPVKKHTDFAGILSATFIGFGAVALLGRAGEFVRPYLIAQQEEVTVPSQLSVWLLERFLDMLMILALAGLAVSQADWGSNAELAAWAQGAGYAITGGAAFVLLALFVLPRRFLQFRNLVMKLASPLPESLRDTLGVFLARIDEGFQGMRDISSVGYALGSSALMWFILGLAFDFLLRACLPQHSFNPTQVLVFMGLLMAGSVLQIPGIGGGLQVATVAALTKVFGVAEESATASAIVIWVVTFLVAIPPALALLAAKGMTLGSLRQLESEANASGP